MPNLVLDNYRLYLYLIILSLPGSLSSSLSKLHPASRRRWVCRLGCLESGMLMSLEDDTITSLVTKAPVTRTPIMMDVQAIMTTQSIVNGPAAKRRAICLVSHRLLPLIIY